MNGKAVSISCILLAVLGLVIKAWSNESLELYERIIRQAREYDRANLYAQEVEELQKAIDIAEANNLEKEYISATIDLAELKRKTSDFQRGIDLLMKLEGTDKYPRLHIRKMGRLAAIYNEYEIDPDDYGRFDSVRHYLKLAIPLAESGEFKGEEASLKNELACLIQWTQGDEFALPLFKESADLFKELGDTANYAVLQTHILKCYFELGKPILANQVQSELLPLVKAKNWPQIKLNLYNLLAHHARQNGDSLSFYKWNFFSEEQMNEYTRSSFNNQMASFRILYDVESYKLETFKKEQKIKQEQNRNRIMAFSLVGVLTVLSGIGFLLFRERKLKRQLDSTNRDLSKANEKYQMLLIESNHRIKNNLQMVISMMEYAKEGLDDKNSAAFQRMSGKVQTVSALHKHLYMETHNESMSMFLYFDEIIELYQKLSEEEVMVKSYLDKELRIPSERLVYFGLIFNEMMANTIEHHSTKSMNIRIEIQKINNHYVYYYEDGSNFIESADLGTGSMLIEGLVDRVEGFNFKKDTSKGVYQFEFYV